LGRSKSSMEVGCVYSLLTRQVTYQTLLRIFTCSSVALSLKSKKRRIAVVSDVMPYTLVNTCRRCGRAATSVREDDWRWKLLRNGSTHLLNQWSSIWGTPIHLRLCITWIIYQQLWEYKIEEKLHLEACEQKGGGGGGGVKTLYSTASARIYGEVISKFITRDILKFHTRLVEISLIRKLKPSPIWSRRRLVPLMAADIRRTNILRKKQTPWSESASELYRPSDRRLSAKWLPTFADKGATRILGFLDRSSYFSIK
jgi:hypothetical protein